MRQIAVSGNWAVASDGLQWMLQKRRKGRVEWQSKSFVHSDLEILVRCMREAGTPFQDVGVLISGLPPTFSAWVEKNRLCRITSN